jgi:DNA-binding CsgD family transcriptional regulator
MTQGLCPVIVGRDAELAALRRTLSAALDGVGQCVLLVGEPGIGKSRLARDLAEYAAKQGTPVVSGRAVPASASTAYRPLAEALMQLFRQRPLPDDPNFAPWIPILQPLIPARVDGGPAQRDVAPSLRGEAVLELLNRASPEGLVLVLEDLHWADPDTVAVVEYLADNLAQQPTMLILTLRDNPASAALELAGRLRARPGVLRLGLDRLDDGELTEMIRTCQPDAAGEVVARVVEVSEGIPLLVEDLLASPGLPVDFAATVRARLDDLSDNQRQVIETAAVLGRHFDWQLLPGATGQSDDAVADALTAGVRTLLLASQGADMRFRHALTREAVLDTLIPPRQRELARAALSALTAADPHPTGDRREPAVDLALRAGDRYRAGHLLAESGREALAWGALSTAADALRRAADLLAGSSDQAAAELDLLGALALAGRVDEAAAVGGRLVSRLSPDAQTVDARVEAHTRLAQAAIAASRWRMARYHLDEALVVAGQASPESPAAARLKVLEAELTMMAGDHDKARGQAEEVLRGADATADVRCHAYEIVGRIRRSVDSAAGRAAFENAFVTAEAADLPVWRLRALHELGTIDLGDHAGVERLLEARQGADRMGAISTAAILDLQLSAGYTCHWDLDACDRHATSALALAERLGLHQVRAKALALLAGSASMRADLAETERYASLTVAAAPEDPMLEGFCWASRGMALLLGGDGVGAIQPYARGMAILAKLPHAEPAALRALWPLVLAARADRRARAAIDEAHRLGVTFFRLNGAMVGYAEAILAARQGDVRRATELVTLADTGWTNCQGWADLCRLLAAPAAASDGWADVAQWLAGASERFSSRRLDALAGQCRGLLARARPNPWAGAGITDREGDVLRLVTEGLANKAIAARLHLSPRTVEKHVESLLRKTGARSRTELATRLGGRASPSERREPSATT